MNEYHSVWQQLTDAIIILEKKADHDERDHLVMKQCLAQLHLIQPFDWMHWPAPPISEVDLDQLDISDCVRHITRIVRAERFAENSLAGWIQSGHFRKLCEAAQRRTSGRRAPSLPKEV